MCRRVDELLERDGALSGISIARVEEAPTVRWQERKLYGAAKFGSPEV
jgi:hypothetical protein